MNYLTLEEILRLHFEVINDYGGAHGVRDEGRLQSVVAASRPRHTTITTAVSPI